MQNKRFQKHIYYNVMFKKTVQSYKLTSLQKEQLMHKRAITTAKPADFNSLTLDVIHITTFFNSKIYLQIKIIHNTSCFVEILTVNT